MHGKNVHKSFALRVVVVATHGAGGATRASCALLALPLCQQESIEKANNQRQIWPKMCHSICQLVLIAFDREWPSIAQ